VIARRVQSVGQREARTLGLRLADLQRVFGVLDRRRIRTLLEFHSREQLVGAPRVGSGFQRGFQVLLGHREISLAKVNFTQGRKRKNVLVASGRVFQILFRGFHIAGHRGEHA